MSFVLKRWGFPICFLIFEHAVGEAAFHTQLLFLTRLLQSRSIQTTSENLTQHFNFISQTILLFWPKKSNELKCNQAKNTPLHQSTLSLISLTVAMWSQLIFNRLNVFHFRLGPFHASWLFRKRAWLSHYLQSFFKCSIPWLSVSVLSLRSTSGFSLLKLAVNLEVVLLKKLLMVFDWSWAGAKGIFLDFSRFSFD